MNIPNALCIFTQLFAEIEPLPVVELIVDFTVLNNILISICKVK